MAISLGWFNHDGALVAVKYRFIEPHTYTDKDGKEQTGKDGKGVRFTSRGQIEGNTFGWQALRGADKVDVLIVCEGELNALSLWQVGRGAVDVLSTGSEATTKKLPPVVVDLAAKYKHCIVWADKKDIADKAAAQIGAASMASPGGKDANDLLQAGKLGALLTAMLGRLGVELPAESRTDDTPVRIPTSHTGMRTGDTLIIKDAQPFDLSFDTDTPATPPTGEPAPLPPMRNRTGKPALPADQWVDCAALAEALQAQRQLSAQHATACGLDNQTGRYYVRGYGWQWVTP
jgi:hypothetical protein